MTANKFFDATNQPSFALACIAVMVLFIQFALADVRHRQQKAAGMLERIWAQHAMPNADLRATFRAEGSNWVCIATDANGYTVTATAQLIDESFGLCIDQLD